MTEIFSGRHNGLGQGFGALLNRMECISESLAFLRCTSVEWFTTSFE